LQLKGNTLTKATEQAVLNANYLMEKLRSCGYHVPFYGKRMHEFVLSLGNLKQHGIRALDVAKRLLDYGFHPPTIYFPLIVDEAFMIEPTEDETMDTLDAFAQAMGDIVQEKTEVVKQAPHTTPVTRVDEVYAATNTQLTWKDLQISSR
jgi:glycine dehydrogenase subunit 2